MRSGLVRRMGRLETTGHEAQCTRLAAMSDAELEAVLGPEAGAWLDQSLSTLDEAEMDGLPLEVQPPYSPAQRRLLAAWHGWQEETR